MLRSMLTGLGLGSGLMYFFDAAQGKRRRARLRDQVNHALISSETFLEKAGRDWNHRAQGLQHEMKSLVQWRQAVPTERVLAERVRSRLGRYVSHPRAINVTVNQGNVTLSGPILAEEVDQLLLQIEQVPGVERIDNQLQVHQRQDNIAALQGGGPPPGDGGWWRPNLPPATRLALTTVGLGLAGYGWARRSAAAKLMGLLGLGLFLRGSTNLSPRQMLGQEGQPIDLNKTYELQAPVERVYEFITNMQNFADFLPYVGEIEDLGGGRIRWTLVGPAGPVAQLEEHITEQVANERLAWRSAPDSPIEYEGSVRLHRLANNATRVEIHVRYTPPGGWLGDTLASLVGIDPKSQIEKAVVRIKTRLEQDAARQTPPEPARQPHEYQTQPHEGA